MRAVWGLVLAGCTSTVGAPSGPSTRIAACGDPQPFDDAVFSALTTTAWDQNCGGGPLPPTCNHLTLTADGAYSWTAVSDYVERDQSGMWNFFARTEADGIVCLDTGAVLPYTLGSGSLVCAYNGKLVKATWDGGVTWNREHCWPESLGLAGANAWGQSG